MKKWKLLAYYLEGLRVPLVVRVPQVGNSWFKGRQARNLPRAPFATVMRKVRCFQTGPTATVMYKQATLLSKGPPTAVVMFKYLAFKESQSNCNV